MLPILINDVPLQCINQAAIAYHVPAKLILAVMKKEGGKNGLAVKNTNGTYDYGVMQINSIWVHKIAAYGYTAQDLQYNPCKNVMVGTWILSKGLAEKGPAWNSVANYHSHTPRYNQIYRDKLLKTYQNITTITSSSLDTMRSKG